MSCYTCHVLELVAETLPVSVSLAVHALLDTGRAGATVEVSPRGSGTVGKDLLLGIHTSSTPLDLGEFSRGSKKCVPHTLIDCLSSTDLLGDLRICRGHEPDTRGYLALEQGVNSLVGCLFLLLVCKCSEGRILLLAWENWFSAPNNSIQFNLRLILN